MNSTFDKLIKPPKDVRGQLFFEEIKARIVADVKRFVSHTSPTSLYLLKRIGILIETYVLKKHNIDKSNLLMDIVKDIFPAVTDKEIQFIRESVEFLLEQRQIVRIPVLRFAVNLLEEMVKKICPDLFLKLGGILIQQL